MGLPEAYLESEGSSCGCDVCYTASASERGDGKADIPEKGWCRMVVKNRYTNICIDGSTNEKYKWRLWNVNRPVAIDDKPIAPFDDVFCVSSAAKSVPTVQIRIQ